MKRLFHSATIGLISTTRMQQFPSLKPLGAAINASISHPAYDNIDDFFIHEYGLHGTLLRHRKSGAQVRTYCCCML